MKELKQLDCARCPLMTCSIRRKPYEEERKGDGMQCFQYRLSYPSGGVRPRGGATVVFIEAKPDTWVYGVAACSLQDNFCKTRGVEIAKGRAESVRDTLTDPCMGIVLLEDRGVITDVPEHDLPNYADQSATEAICRSFKKAISRYISPFNLENETQEAQLFLTVHPSYCYVKCGDGYRFCITDIDKAKYEDVEE